MRDDFEFRPHGPVGYIFRFVVVNLLDDIALEEPCLKIRRILVLNSCLYHNLDITFILGDLGSVMKTCIY